MKRQHWICILSGLLCIASSLWAQDDPIRIDFSGNSSDENGVTLQGPGFDAFPRAEVTYGKIPLENGFSGATDGMGAIVIADPGEGIMIIGETIHTPQAAVIRCTVQADTSHAAVTLAAIDAGKYQFVSTASPGNGAFFQGQYKRISGFFVPPSTGFRILIQVLNTSDRESLTVYLDRLDVYLLDSTRYYHAQFLDGDEVDPTFLSLPMTGGSTGMDSGTDLTVQPSCTTLNLGETVQLTSDYSIDGVGQLHWWTAKGSPVTVAGNGLTTAMSGGNAWVTAQFGNQSDHALIFVNPLAAFHDDRAYEWYETQMGTGDATYYNCGPACIHMAIRWYSRQDIPIRDIRSLHPRNNGGWYTTDMTNTLDYYRIPYAVHGAQTKQDILDPLQRGNIVILCAQMKWISFNRESYTGRFYDFEWGHFLIVKGATQDGKYFIVYDPFSMTEDYDDMGVMLGRNRFYPSEEVLQACTKWWANCIEIGATFDRSTVDWMNIPVAQAGATRSEIEDE